MAKIGRLGDIIFSVSRKKVKTFSNANWKMSAKYVAHERHLKAPLLEFTGIGAETFTFNMLLFSYLNVSPMDELEKLRGYLKEGKLLRLVIGKKTIGDSYWVITDLQAPFERINNKGNILAVKLAVTLNSYEKR